MIALEFFEVAKKRRSIHYFADEKVSDEDLNYMPEASFGIGRMLLR